MTETLGYDYRIVSNLRGKIIEIYGTDKPINALPKETIFNKIINDVSNDLYLILDCDSNFKGTPHTVSEYVLSIVNKANVKCADNRSDMGYINEDMLLDKLNLMDSKDFSKNQMNYIRTIIEQILFQCDTLQKNKEYYSLPFYNKRYVNDINIIINQLKLVMEFYKLGYEGMKGDDIIKLLDNKCFTNNFNLYIVILINILENIKLLTVTTVDINIVSSILKSSSKKIVIITDKNRCLRLSQHVLKNITDMRNSKGDIIRTIPQEEIEIANEKPITNVKLDEEILSHLQKGTLTSSCSR